jgi:hypothetical protein
VTMRHMERLLNLTEPGSAEVSRTATRSDQTTYGLLLSPIKAVDRPELIFLDARFVGLFNELCDMDFDECSATAARP